MMKTAFHSAFMRQRRDVLGAGGGVRRARLLEVPRFLLMCCAPRPLYTKTMRNFVYIPFVLLIVGGGIFALTKVFSVGGGVASDISFLDCEAATGSVVTNTRPGTCRTPEGEVVVENVSNLAAKKNLVRNVSLAVDQKIQNPLVVVGEARGYWSFEASFPVRLLDGTGKVLGTAIATMQGDWMTEDFVPFTTTLSFTQPGTDVGLLILQKDNPSGLPEHDDEVRIQVRF